MPDYSESVRNIVASFNTQRRTNSLSFRAALELAKPEIRSLAQEALRDGDADGMLLVVSLIHVLVDCCREAVPGDVADLALAALENRVDGGSLQPFVLRGAFLAADDDSLETMTGTLLLFEVFRRVFAPKYGLSADSVADSAELWRALIAGRLEVPAEDLPLGSRLMWFTEEEGLRRACPPRSDEEFLDGETAYDRLGLNWSGRWEEYDDSGRGRARAVLISALLRRRREAPEGLRIPTGLDGWFNLLFVPRPEIVRGPWPAGAGFTVDPRTGALCHPEGVHGRIVVSPGERCPARACGEVSKEVPKRAVECGDLVVRRALERLERS